MAKGIVHILKAVEVEKHHHGASLIGTHLVDDLPQPLPERETVGHTGQRIMVGIVLQPAVLHLQLLFRGLQIVGQRFHTNMGATQIIILSEHQQTESYTHGDQQNGDHRVDIIEMLDFIMGDINDIDILRQVAAAIEVSGPSSSLNTGRICLTCSGVMVSTCLSSR